MAGLGTIPAVPTSPEAAAAVNAVPRYPVAVIVPATSNSVAGVVPLFIETCLPVVILSVPLSSVQPAAEDPATLS